MTNAEPAQRRRPGRPLDAIAIDDLPPETDAEALVGFIMATIHGL